MGRRVKKVWKGLLFCVVRTLEVVSLLSSQVN